MQSFSKWFEATDIYGFEKEEKKDTDAEYGKNEEPMRQLNVELILKYLINSKIGVNEGHEVFANEIQWGNIPGALRITIDPKMTVRIRKLSVDLNGNYHWVAKKHFQLNRSGFGGYEDVIAQEIYQEVKKLENENLEVPSSDYSGFEDMVRSSANKMRRVAKDILLYREIVKKSDDDYIIVFDLRGGGVQAPGQKRIDQFQAEFAYNRSDGLIKTIVNHLESSVGGEKSWTQAPSDYQMIFFPSQDIEEIAEILGVYVKYF